MFASTEGDFLPHSRQSGIQTSRRQGAQRGAARTERQITIPVERERAKCMCAKRPGESRCYGGTVITGTKQMCVFGEPHTDQMLRPRRVSDEQGSHPPDFLLWRGCQSGFSRGRGYIYKYIE